MDLGVKEKQTTSPSLKVSMSAPPKSRTLRAMVLCFDSAPLSEAEINAPPAPVTKRSSRRWARSWAHRRRPCRKAT